jgi:rRNA maturation endonuclease Nob1
MLIALGRGDKYRLAHIREILEIGKELYISDKDFLEDLVKTHLKDKIYQARIVSIPEKSNLFCEECGSEISADEKFCTSCGTEKPESSSPSTSDVPEPTPEPETKLRKHGYQENVGFALTDSGDTFEIPITKSLAGFTFTNDGDIGETVNRKTAREKPHPKKKSRQQELEEYEQGYLAESETKVSWKAYDVKAKRKVEIQNPKAVKMKNGKWAVKGTSPITGIKVFRIVGNEKPVVSAEKTADSPKVEKEQTAPAEKPKGSQKTEPEVFSRYYRSPEVESPKVKSKSKKPNPFCEECGSKIASKDMFCINCGAKR